jgi:biotin carboxylase
MIIGAKWEQVPLISQAKSIGHYVIATDNDINAEGLKIADSFEILDPRNLSEALAIAKKYQVDGVVADECDYSRYAAVYLNVTLNLGGKNNNFMAAQCTNNKLWMRECCREHQIFQPRFIPCKSYDEVLTAVNLIGLPVIIKPVDNRGSTGVHHVTNFEQLKFAFFDAVSNAHSRLVLVEAYIEGLHITVDGCFDQYGKHHNLAIASKKVMSGENPVITQVRYPADLNDDILDHIFDTNNRVVDALGITDGLTHSEFIVDSKGRCFLVETANRGGGVLTSAKIVPVLTGVNSSALLIADALGQKYDIKPVVKGSCVWLHFFIFNPGIVKSISGQEEVKSMNSVVHFQMNISVGVAIDLPKSGAQRHGFVIVKADSPEAVSAEIQKIQDLVVVEYV